jgi:MarR family
MSDPLLPRLKDEIEARLAELRPLVAEATQLEAAKRALLDEIANPSVGRRPLPPRRSSGLNFPTPPAGLRPAPAEEAPEPAAPAPAPAAREEGERAPRGANQEAILALVEERPGVSVAEIASVTKIAKPTVATTVSKLKREGLLADEAGGVKLASRTPLTLAEIAAAAARDTGASDEEWEAASPNSREGAVA